MLSRVRRGGTGPLRNFPRYKGQKTSDEQWFKHIGCYFFHENTVWRSCAITLLGNLGFSHLSSPAFVVCCLSCSHLPLVAGRRLCSTPHHVPGSGEKETDKEWPRASRQEPKLPGSSTWSSLTSHPSWREWGTGAG